MKRAALVLAFALLLSIVATIQVVKVAEANPLPPSWMNPKMDITIQSPLNGTNNALPVFVNFTALCSGEFFISSDYTSHEDWINAFFYVLDGQYMKSSGTNFTEIQLTATHPDVDHFYEYSGQTYLTNLTDGSHSITVYWGVLVKVGTPAEFIVCNESWSATSQFSVNTEAAPELPKFSLWIILPLLMMATLISTVFFKKRKH
jgi:hypothetical protein